MWTPVEDKERYNSLDLLRGFALFGVLLINLLYFFRESLFVHFFEPRTAPIDWIAGKLIEFKAFDLFSLSFGIGLGVQAERAGKRGVSAEIFLVRRFLVLLGIGIVHMVLISNVDILILYAVCGMAVIPVLRFPARILAPVGLAAVFGPVLLSRWVQLPDEAVRVQGALATQAYAQNGFVSLIGFRWTETVRFILPLLISVAQNSWGMMLLGVAVWRSGVVRAPERYRGWLWLAAVVLGVSGLALKQHVLLAFGYGSALLAWRAPALKPFASLGRMALTNYLMQSVIFSLIFCGYGLGLFGKMTTASALALGIAVYAGQLAFSTWWLGRWRFGPMEWIWRSLTYGRRQKMSYSPTRPS